MKIVKISKIKQIQQIYMNHLILWQHLHYHKINNNINKLIKQP